MRQTIAAGVEDLVRIGVDKCYFYFEDELTKQSIVFPGKIVDYSHNSHSGAKNNYNNNTIQ